MSVELLNILKKLAIVAVFAVAPALMAEETAATTETTDTTTTEEKKETTTTATEGAAQ